MGNRTPGLLPPVWEPRSSRRGSLSLCPAVAIGTHRAPRARCAGWRRAPRGWGRVALGCSLAPTRVMPSGGPFVWPIPPPHRTSRHRAAAMRVCCTTRSYRPSGRHVGLRPRSAQARIGLRMALRWPIPPPHRTSGDQAGEPAAARRRCARGAHVTTRQGPNRPSWWSGRAPGRTGWGSNGSKPALLRS